MKIYTKTNAHHPMFDIKNFYNISECKLEENCIYWYDQHDCSTRGTPFNQFINQENWNHLKNDKSSIILIFYPDEYYNRLDLEDWANTLIRHEISPEQVYVVSMDNNFVDWTEKTLKEYGIVGINIQSHNELLERVYKSLVNYPVSNDLSYMKKFSAFSRNYGSIYNKPYRLFLFTELYRKKLLNDFYYTFNIVNPYGEIQTYSKEQIKNNLIEFGYSLDGNLEQWVANMPYVLNDNSIREKMAVDIYDVLNQSAIHLTVESHFDPFWNFLGHVNEDIQKFSPCFPTEKTYKPIALKKPFIMFSTPFFLKEFKLMGYKTFSPFIDESYDLIVDNEDRLHAIVNEVSRLCKLPDVEFNTVLQSCRDICEHNYKVYIEAQKSNGLKLKFEFLKQLMMPE